VVGSGPGRDDRTVTGHAQRELGGQAPDQASNSDRAGAGDHGRTSPNIGTKPISVLSHARRHRQQPSRDAVLPRGYSHSVLEARHPTSRRRRPHRPTGARSRRGARGPGGTSAHRSVARLAFVTEWTSLRCVVCDESPTLSSLPSGSPCLWTDASGTGAQGTGPSRRPTGTGGSPSLTRTRLATQTLTLVSRTMGGRSSGSGSTRTLPSRRTEWQTLSSHAGEPALHHASTHDQHLCRPPPTPLAWRCPVALHGPRRTVLTSL
jgi:hypothetical protein